MCAGMTAIRVRAAAAGGGLLACVALAAAAGRDAGDPVRGRQLLAQYQCGSCHVIPGVEAARGGFGPPLAAFGRRSYIAGRLPNRAATLAAWIVAPSVLVPSATMPAMGADLRDARDMAAYLGRLR
jgi:cytochrome c